MVDKVDCEKLTVLYQEAWNAIKDNTTVTGEVERARHLNPSSTTSVDFLREYAWTVCGGGFKVETVKRFFPRLEIAFKRWDYEAVLQDKEEVRAASLQVFGNKNKINAILKAAEFIKKYGWDSVKAHLLEGMMTMANGYIKPSDECTKWLNNAYEIRELSWMGKTLQSYLLKNLGFDMAKNDIMLARLVEKYGTQLGYKADADGIQRFAEDTGKCVGERTSVIETVLWNAWETGSL